MRDEDRRHGERLDLLRDLVSELTAQRWIQGGERFVQEQEPWPSRERAGDRDSLRFPSGVRRGQPRGEVLGAHRRERTHRLLSPL
jgi:hypothetical protein